MKKVLLLLPLLTLVAGCPGGGSKAPARPPDTPPIAPPGQPGEQQSPGIPKMPGS